MSITGLVLNPGIEVSPPPNVVADLYAIIPMLVNPFASTSNNQASLGHIQQLLFFCVQRDIIEFSIRYDSYDKVHVSSVSGPLVALDDQIVFESWCMHLS